VTCQTVGHVAAADILLVALQIMVIFVLIVVGDIAIIRTLVGSLVGVVLSQGIILVVDHVIVHVVISSRAEAHSCWGNVCVDTSQSHGPWLFGESLLALHHFSIDLVEVDLTDLVNNILIVEGDESEAPVSVGHLVVGQHRLLDHGKLFEVGFDILQAGGGRQASNKDLLGSHHQLGVRLAGNSNLWLNQFSIQLVSWIGQDLVDTPGVDEGDEAEASGSPGGGILHDHDLCHVSELGEILPHVLGGGLPRQASNEHLARIVGDLIQIDRSQRRKQA